MDAATQRAMAGFGAATPDGPAGLAVRGYLAEQSRAFLTHSALPVQQSAAVRLRTACLRVGTALAACRELVDAVWAQELGRELETTAVVLGAERDTDAVRPRLLAPLDLWIEQGRYPDGGAARTRTLLTRMLDRERSAAHSHATAALVGPAFHALADRMATLARDVPLTPAAERPARAVLPELAQSAYEEFARRIEDLPEPLAAEDADGDAAWLAAEDAALAALHIAELCRPAAALIAGETPADLLARLTALVEALAGQRDAVLAAACVHRAADTPRIAATTGYVLGRLHEEQRLAVLRARSTAPLPVRERSGHA
ncbi:CHAD domain-containing protein [Catenulispora sp. NF23]|uniref:CHAD domain-containing protein n=1 Tax=Catenulispora pinistramenti TaxID=2705254 RepID=A0ABS5KX31_9ACTN|nr:CHAD domain-containing protein [Catenulispora pinistramenti]MBS2533933.1 CHAD domain-containing protein [Catenulispora pinistramenti]MBS2550618.1 CHAD domain-containing protein [Catenulispora pinistramenti]